MFRSLIILLGAMLLPSAAAAQNYQMLIDQDVRVCEAGTSDDSNSALASAPDFASPDCEAELLYKVDPQGRELWIEHIFRADPALLEDGKPLGLFVSAKASSELFLNGVPLGSNGTPGRSALSEEPGDMDAVFFVPEGTLRSGDNRLVMRMSAMRGAITLDSPIHNVALAHYRDPRQPGPGTWFAIVTFGLFLAAFVYFGVSALRGKDREGSALIALTSIFLAAQLASEAWRDLLPYPYPLHDLRLTLILIFAIGAGISLFAFVLQVLFKRHRTRRLLAIGAVSAIMLCIAVWQRGFDLKTTFVLITAALAVSIAGIFAGVRQDRRGWWIAAIGAIITWAIYWLGGQFLDIYLYLLMAALILWLLFRQARRPEVLQAEVARSDPPLRIELNNSGKVEFVEAADVVRFSGAGDYVEVFLTDGRSSLYNGSLAALERELTGGFIRVHRSHIVNASLVKSLERESAGTGQLNMADGSVVPVSRRNLASVRGALTRN